MDCWGACEIKWVDYGSKSAKYLLRTHILRCIREVSDFDVALEGISMKLNELRLTELPSSYSIEKELRMIFYKPEKGAEGIITQINGKRERGSDGNYIEYTESDDNIFFNFDDSTIDMNVVIRDADRRKEKDLQRLARENDINLIIRR